MSVLLTMLVYPQVNVLELVSAASMRGHLQIGSLAEIRLLAHSVTGCFGQHF